MNQIPSISHLPSLQNLTQPAQLANGLPDGDPAFKNLLLQALDHVNSMQSDADHAVEQLVTGGEVNTAEVLTSIQKADMTFRMMTQIRNKLVQAYQELKEVRI